jgi:hypothetical protein
MGAYYISMQAISKPLDCRQKIAVKAYANLPLGSTLAGYGRLARSPSG